ncbi:DNA recombination and repair protein RecF [Cronobacter sakazakii 696]|nr:DNA recombination and repair protein RecF [Cronobacter sakazakii 696]
MSLTRLLIKDFRNIENADLALSPGFNFLVGANGSGKTSVLEAIYTLGHGRAFRSLQIGRVIRHEQDAFILHGRLQGDEREVSVGLTKDRNGDSTVRIDGSDGHKVAELAQLMPMQLITPEGFTLLGGGPKYRRAFLDWGCFHNEPGFFVAWSNLKRLLKQRNAALRQVTRYEQLRPWDRELVPLAEQISQWRASYSEAIANDMADTCAQFLPEFSLTFSFQRGWEKESDYADVLERGFERDRMLTYTAHGPHKADFRIRACRAGSLSS